jgi:hypothetical protein
MLAFGLSFIKMPHVRARWFTNARSKDGVNAQVAAHLDHDLRRIYPSLVLQMLNSLSFGFQAIAKRFELRTPGGTYIQTNPETGEQEELPIWSEGSIQPIGWKPFVGLRPEAVEPVWSSAGEFDGIEYSPGDSSGAPGGVGAASTGGGSGGDDKEKTYKIDLYHSLWFTHEREESFGSIYGYPRLGYAYRWWWSYWFRWAIADRAFERKADPSVLVRHPEGDFIDENTGESMSYSEYALLMGERMRSGGVIALPSEVYEDASGKGTTPMWEIDFTKDATNFDPFDKSFSYLDSAKIRALAMPEQYIMEGSGGTSSRNVTAEMGSAFIESQAVLSAQMTDQVNRFLIPQWLAVNYPEFVAEGGTAEMVVHGFADEDVDFTNQVIQLIGQQEAGMTEIMKLVDLKRILQAKGTPIAEFGEQQRREAQVAQEAAAQQAPLIEPGPGQVGIVPGETGFSTYINPREVIYLADSGTEFIDNLPQTNHYEDKAVKGFSRRLWNLYHELYTDEYRTILNDFENSDDPIEFSDDPVEMAVGDVLQRAKELLRNSRVSRLWPQTLQTSQIILKNIMLRASRNELRKSGLKAVVDQEAFDTYLTDHIADFAAKVSETSRNEVQDFMAARMQEGVTDRVELAKQAREHFVDDFPKWKSDRLVRTEVARTYNQAVLLAAEQAGVELVQATDGREHDSDCTDRDGKLFTISEAQREVEHPNGALGWKIVPVALSVERVEDVGIEQAIGRYDAENQKVLLSQDASLEQERNYLKLVVATLISQRVVDNSKEEQE